MGNIERDEMCKLLGAAQGYAGVSVGTIADGIGVSSQTLYRTIRGQRSALPHELDAVADFCGVPRAFFKVGFRPMLAEDIESTKGRLKHLKAAA